MSLEAATYLSDLIPTNPPSADPVAQGANHLRLLKTVLQTTFPAITGAVTASHTALNAVPTLSTSLAALQTDAVSKTVDTASTASLTITGTGKRIDAPAVWQGGAALVPRGAIVMWSGSTSAVPSGWQLCDGTNGTPDLRGSFILGAGGSYAALATGGSSTYTGTSNTAGSHAHGTQTGQGGAHGHSGYTTTNGAHSHFGVTGDHTLNQNEIPAHSHTFPCVADGGTGIMPGGRNGAIAGPWTTDINGGGNGPHNHPINADGSHYHNFDTSAVGDHNHSIAADGAHSHTVSVSGTPPYVALGLIMKL